MISNTAQQLPPCPAFCTAPKPREWESTEADGRLSRGHSAGTWPAVPANGGYHSVQVSVGVDEVRGEGLPRPVAVTVEAPTVDLTPRQARAVAHHLMDAADRCQQYESGRELYNDWLRERAAGEGVAVAAPPRGVTESV